MPGSSGFGITEELRNRNKKAKLVFVSDTPDYAEDAWKYHVNDYLLKPITTETWRHLMFPMSLKTEEHWCLSEPFPKPSAQM